MSDADELASTKLLSTFESMMFRELRSLKQSMHALEAKVLTINDVDRMLHVMSMRRAMVLPWSHMANLMQDSVDMLSLVGKPAYY